MKSRHHVRLGVLVSLICGASSLPALTAFALTVVSPGTECGICWDIEASGDLAFIAMYNEGVRILDVSRLPEHDEVARIPTDATVKGLDIKDGLLYAAEQHSEGSRLRILDVSIPGAPVSLGSVEIPGKPISDVRVSGSHAFVANHYHGLVIVDVADPAAPTIVSSMDLGGIVIDVEISGDFAYFVMASYPEGLKVVDVSDPASPQLVASLAPVAREARIVGTLLLLAAYEEGLQVFDIADPAAPQLLASVPAIDRVTAVTMAGDLAYLIDGGLRVVDLSNPSHPIPLGSIVHGWESIEIVGHYALFPTSDGLSTVDVSLPFWPGEMARVPTDMDPWDLSIEGTTAYVSANSIDGFQIFDVSNPAAPDLLGSFDTNSAVFTAAVVDGIAYLASYVTGIKSVDVSDPTAPVLVASKDLDHFDGTWDLTVQGDRLYVAEAPGLWIIDLTPGGALLNPRSVALPGWAFGVAVQGDYAYVAAMDWDDQYNNCPDSGALHVVDISDSSAPALVDSLALDDCPLKVVADGDWAYVMYGGGPGVVTRVAGGRASILDISNPAEPILAGWLPESDGAFDIDIVGRRAYVAQGPFFSVYDIRDPIAATLVVRWRAPDDVAAVARARGLVWVATEGSELYGVDLGPEYKASSRGCGLIGLELLVVLPLLRGLLRGLRDRGSGRPHPS